MGWLCGYALRGNGNGVFMVGGERGWWVDVVVGGVALDSIHWRGYKGVMRF